MSEHEIHRRAAELAERGEPFALATVVARTPPSSARVGGKAIVRADGTLEGWLGGSCIEPVVRREAAAALLERRPRYVILAPDGEAERPGASVHPMTCHSGGTVEIFVEPTFPAPALTLFGDSPVNRALCRLGPVAGFRVEVVDPEDPAAFPEARVVEDLRPASGTEEAGGAGTERFAVVATMGEWDEEAVRRAVEAGARYVGLVASPARAEEVLRRLEAAGASWDGRIRSPAGLDLGAEEPGEIAVTILAEVIAARRQKELPGAPPPERVDGDVSEVAASGEGAAASEEVSEAAASGEAAAPEPAFDWTGPWETEPDGPEAEPSTGTGGERAEPDTRAPAAGSGAPASRPEVAVDPVCGMEVDVDRSRHVYVHRGETYHFCCVGCRERFAREPERWIEAAEVGGPDGG